MLFILLCFFVVQNHPHLDIKLHQLWFKEKNKNNVFIFISHPPSNKAFPPNWCPVWVYCVNATAVLT